MERVREMLHREVMTTEELIGSRLAWAYAWLFPVACKSVSYILWGLVLKYYMASSPDGRLWLLSKDKGKKVQFFD